MSVLHINGTFGLLGMAKGWSTPSAARIDGATPTRPIESPTRRIRTAAITHVRESDLFEEDCERWDGLA